MAPILDDASSSGHPSMGGLSSVVGSAGCRPVPKKHGGSIPLPPTMWASSLTVKALVLETSEWRFESSLAHHNPEVFDKFFPGEIRPFPNRFCCTQISKEGINYGKNKIDVVGYWVDQWIGICSIGCGRSEY